MIWTALFLFISLSTSRNYAKVIESSNSEQDTVQMDSSAELSCGIWLAPSTIPGAGLGMYAGKAFSKGDFLQDVGDLVIPIVDIEEHAEAYSEEKWDFLWDEYTWNAENLHMNTEGSWTVNSASPGFGAAANSFLGIYNVEEYLPHVDMTGLHRAMDPGAGAFTPYYDRKSAAIRDIEVGEELFVSYGENWFESRSHFGPIPLFNELDTATDLARTFHRLCRDVNLSEDAQADLWGTFIQNSEFTDSRVFGAFSHNDVNEVKKLKTLSLKELRILQSTKTLDWLRLHGTCGDHIVAGPSTLRQAGHGGFASRDLPKGTVVSHLPLIHVTNRDRLLMYNMEADGNPDKDLGVLGKQLLLNYCFGHRDSSLLLCPYGPMTNYVNHNVTSANVEIRWADPGRGNHMPELLTRDLESLESDATAKLAFEMVTIRDVAAGEEIFLNYGGEWENAWQHHLSSYEPGSSEYVPAWKLNKDKDGPLKTVFEEFSGSRYPGNVEVRCNKVFVVVDEEKWREKREEGYDAIQELIDDKSEPMLPCEVLSVSQTDNGFHYSVVMFEEDEEDNSQLVNHRVDGIPRQGINFHDRPYTSDFLQHGVFRHDIRIPDHMFPPAWRNLKAEQETTER